MPTMFPVSATIGGRHEHLHRSGMHDSRARLLDVPRMDLPTGFIMGLTRSSMGFELSNLDIEFFRLVDARDIDGVIDFMACHPKFDANVVDYNGRCGLVHSVTNDDEDLTHFLLQLPNIELQDSILHAIKMGNTAITQLLLDHQRQHGIIDEFQVFEESSDFASYITPLILAAHMEDYPIIHLLLERGHFIEKPHPPNCFCKEKCNEVKKKGETLQDCFARYNAYKALASPVFIGQTSDDPLLTAFQLSFELRLCSEKEPEFKKEYSELSKRCSKFAVELLDRCRTSKEVSILLHNKKGFPRSPENVGLFSRVALAVDMDQKEFVAHTNSQQVLRAAWLGNWQDWRGLSFSTKIVRLLPRMLLLPVMSLMYWLMPRAKFTETWRSPVNKFFSYVASYLIFLLILYMHNHLDNQSFVRGAPTTGLELPVLMYILGLIWRDIKMLWKQGSDKFFAQRWNWYNIVMNGNFILTFLTWGWAEYEVAMNDDRYVPRSHWYQYDLNLIAEASYSVATILAYGRLLYFFQIGNRLGPLQTSLSYMLRDICDFMVIFMVVVVSFACGLHKLYHYYTGQVRNINGEITVQSEAFESLQSTIKTEFWALYGYSPPQFADVVIAEEVQTVGNETVIVVNKHKFTESVGYLLFGTYNVTAIIILLNMLIAMMSTSFMNVQDNADIEWKFCRTQVWLEFFEEGGTLPPPFNLIPAPKSFYYFFNWVHQRIAHNPEARFSMLRCCYMEKKKKEEYEEKEYQALMNQLIQRYLRHRDHSSDSSSLTSQELDAVKQEVSDLQQMTRKLYIAICGPDKDVSHVVSDDNM